MTTTPPPTASPPTASPTTPRPPAPAPTDAPARRIVALDVLRGFALTGIIFVNVEPVTRFPSGLATLADPSGWLQLFVQQRFFPLFSLLFGISFSLLLASAQRRGARPRVVLARRLLVLAPLGVLHQLVHPGEALAFYAAFGLLVLLPSTWLPRAVVAVGAVVAVATSLAVFGGGVTLIPGVFLLGSTLVRYGMVARLEDSARVPLLLLVVLTAAAVPAVAWQLREGIESSGFTTSSGVAGFVMAGAYASAVLVALRTPARGALVAVFAPLGRMALTNYVGATVLMLLAALALDLSHSTSWAQVLGLAAGIIVVQAVVSRWWLARYRYGPLEWAWRWATWGTRPAMVR